jgi:hypothetical protein
VYWRIDPRASSTLIAGSVTIPSGTPMTPMGIWRTVNAIVRAVIEPTARATQRRR